MLRVEEERKIQVEAKDIAKTIAYGFTTGFSSLVPIFPYVGSKGYLPLSVPLAAISTLIIGFYGIIASFIGGLIGMLLAPAAYPLRLIDVLLTATMPSILTYLTIRNDRYWFITVPTYLALIGWFLVFPYYAPGEAGGFSPPPQPAYLLIGLIYWLPWLIIVASPLGIRIFPSWIRKDGLKRFIALFFIVEAAMTMWSIPWFLPYWYVRMYSGETALRVLVSYSWWFPAISFIIGVLGFVSLRVMEALGESF